MDANSDIIDSPGIQEFGLNHIKDENLAWGFIEFHPYIGQCKFSDCRHTREPGCAVMQAVQTGKIHRKRLDIYHRLLFDGKKPINCFKYAKKKDENSKFIVINGVSKQYAMTGFRIGWVVGNKKVIEAMSNIQGHQTSGPSVLLQKAAVAAINGIQSGVESLRATLENNRNVMVDLLRSFEGVKDVSYTHLTLPTIYSV